jgi:hypothetical protein
MPGSQTTQGPPDARNSASTGFAFRQVNNVGTLIHNAFAAPWLAYTLPYRRFADPLAEACARIGADVGSYSFIVMDCHHLLLAGLPAHSLSFVSLIHTCPRYIPGALTPMLTTTTLYRSSLEWFGACS